MAPNIAARTGGEVRGRLETTSKKKRAFLAKDPISREARSPLHDSYGLVIETLSMPQTAVLLRPEARMMIVRVPLVHAGMVR